MAVQAGCGFKAPTPVFAVPLPVSPGEPARRLGGGVTSAPAPRDSGSDVMVGGRLSGGQWVTLSKALLLQLVERICQLSFQNDAMTSSSNRKSLDQLAPEVEIASSREQSSTSTDAGGRRGSERAREKDSEPDVAKDDVAAEQCRRTTLCRDNCDVSTRSQTSSGSAETPPDERSCAVVERNPTAVELDTVETNSCGGGDGARQKSCATAEQAGSVRASRGDEVIALDDGWRRRRERRRRQRRTACRRRRLLLARRRNTPVTSAGQGQVRCDAR